MIHRHIAGPSCIGITSTFWTYSAFRKHFNSLGPGVVVADVSNLTKLVLEGFQAGHMALVVQDFPMDMIGELRDRRSMGTRCSR